MKKLLLPLLGLLCLCGCYDVEDAADVNQERIKATYCTVFNATRETTKSLISFKFGNTPLRVSNPLYFEELRLFEKENTIFGLHYSRQLDGFAAGTYQWTDEEGQVYQNFVETFGFDLTEEITELKKHTYYKLPWEGAQIPYEAGDFTITIESHVDHSICSFHAGELLEIESDQLHEIPVGKARMKISRNYSEPIDEGTQAGGDSDVSFVREYEISIVE